MQLWVPRHRIFFCYFFFLILINLFFLLDYIVLVLPYINMNPPQVYMCSQSSPYHPSGSSQCTSPKHPISCIEPGLAIHFTYDIIHISMPFSQIIQDFLKGQIKWGWRRNRGFWQYRGGLHGNSFRRMMGTGPSWSVSQRQREVIETVAWPQTPCSPALTAVTAVCWEISVINTTKPLSSPQTPSLKGPVHALVWPTSHSFPTSQTLISRWLGLMFRHQQEPSLDIPFASCSDWTLPLPQECYSICSCVVWWLPSLPYCLVLLSLEVG